jgi:hypothetical protein
MSRGSLLLVLAASAAVVAGAIAARALDDRPDPAAQAVADGCGRDRGAIIRRLSSNWAFVGDGHSAASGPAPPQRWAHGTVSSAYDGELAAHPTGIDDPFTHRSYDFVFNLLPVPRESYLVGGDPVGRTGNFEDRNEQTGRIHVERESISFPRFAWPDAGDRVSVLGSWVWDCDHFSGGEHTELHPFHALWVVRRHSPRSPFGDVEGDLLLTGVPTVADDQALCAHRTRGDQAAFQRCLGAGMGAVDVAGSYRFVLDVPARPAPGARFFSRVVDAGSRGASRVRVSRRGARLSVLVDAGTPGTVVAKRIIAGWRPVPERALPVHLRIRFIELLVRRAMDPGCQPTEPACPARNESTRLGQVTKPPGEWNVYFDAAGVWTAWRPAVVRPFDGSRIRGHQSVDVYVPRHAAWRLFAQTRECDFGTIGPLAPCPRMNEVGNLVGDDEPGILAARFRSPLAALGLHRANSRLHGSTCPPANRHGCYRLTFRVARLPDEPRRALSSRQSKRGKAG